MISRIHEHLATFETYPPRLAATTLKIDDMIEKMTRAGGGQGM